MLWSNSRTTRTNDIRAFSLNGWEAKDDAWRETHAAAAWRVQTSETHVFLHMGLRVQQLYTRVYPVDFLLFAPARAPPAADRANFLFQERTLPYT